MALYHGGASSGAVAEALELMLLDSGKKLDIVNVPNADPSRVRAPWEHGE